MEQKSSGIVPNRKDTEEVDIISKMWKTSLLFRIKECKNVTEEKKTMFIVMTFIWRGIWLFK